MEDVTPELFDVFTIGDNTFPNNSREHLDLRSKPIQDAFFEQAELYAWYATAQELAMDVEARLKEEVARVYARLDHHHRSAGKASGVKMTEKMTENSVITDPQYVKIHGEYLDAKRNTGLLKASKEAMIHRKDMLIQMGANYRAEGQSDISIKQAMITQGNK